MNGERGGIERWLWTGEKISKDDDVALRDELAYRAGPNEPAIGHALHDSEEGMILRIEARE
jgi:hypothetical protein